MEETTNTLSHSSSQGNSETESPPKQSFQKSGFDFAIGNRIGSDSSSMGKKKRGRPRKYDPDGNLSLSYKKSLQSVKLASPPLPGFVISPDASDYSSSSKKGRGRPSSGGSGNWNLLASLGELFANSAGADFIPHVVTVNAGEDVAGKILTFSQKGARGICILSANGTVSNVTIRQPGSSGGLLTYEGRFELLSLTGSFTITDMNGVRTRTGGMSVSLAGPDGRVIGGGIAGSLIASSPIQIVVGSFMPSSSMVHKKKHQGVSGTVTKAIPISQASPGGENYQVLPYPSSSQGPSNEHIDNGKREMFNITPSHNSVTWNGLSPMSDHRSSPDINMSAVAE